MAINSFYGMIWYSELCPKEWDVNTQCSYSDVLSMYRASIFSCATKWQYSCIVGYNCFVYTSL